MNLVLYWILMVATPHLLPQPCICGRIENYDPQDNQRIHLFRPIQSAPQGWYSDSSEDLLIEPNGSFHRNYNIPFKGFCKLVITGKTAIDINIQQPGDSVYIKLKEDTGHYVLQEIRGTNGSGNQLIHQLQNEMDVQLNKIKFDSTNPGAIWETIDKIETGSKNKARFLRNNMLITDSFYTFLENYIESEMLYLLEVHYLNYNLPKTTVPLFIDSLYKKYYPFRTEYIYANALSPYNIDEYIMYSKKGFISQHDSHIKTADQQWIAVDSSYLQYSRLTEPFREIQIATNILYGLQYNTPNIKNAVMLFARQYPQSEFNSINLRVALPLIAGKHENIDSSIIFIKDSLNLRQIISKYFKGRMLLIDNWATWCGPCVAELSYLKEKDSILARNHIGELFISYDSPGMENQWKAIVEKYDLEGVHILGNSGLKEDISHISGIEKGKPLPIPRYILIGANGQILSANFNRPSEGQFLKSIENYLK